MNKVDAAVNSALIVRGPLLDPYREKRRNLIIGEMAMSVIGNGVWIKIVGEGASWLVAIMDTTSFTIVDLSAILNGLDEDFGPGTKEELELFERNRLPDDLRIALLVAALGLAIAGRSPAALPAIRYYPGALGYILATILYLQGMITSGRSQQLLFYRLYGMRSLDEMGKKIEGARAKALGLIDQYQTHFRRSRFKAAEIENVRGKTTVTDLLTAILLKPMPEGNRGGAIELAGRGSAYAIGVWLFISYQLACTLYTYEDVGGLGGVLLSIAMLVSTGYLFYDGITDTTARVLSGVLELALRRIDPTFAEQLRPEVTYLSKTVAPMINLSAFGSTYVAWGDFFTGFQKDYFVWVGGAALWLFALTASLDIIEGRVEEAIFKDGQPHEKAIIQLKRDLKRLKKILSKCSLQDFCVFLRNTSPEIREKLGIEEGDLSA